MVATVSLAMLAFALSLDSFGVGLTYGLRKIRIPLVSLVFIGCCSGISILIAMGFGTILQTYLSVNVAETLGALILIGIGAWALFETYRPKKSADPRVEVERSKVDLEFKLFGFVIHILREPETADLDRSGTVTGKEAFLLGLALSLDAFGAGIGAALMGFSPIWLALCVGGLSAFLVLLGMKFGYIFSNSRVIRRLSFIPGLLLIILGVMRL
ncbi:sporulation membrane protein YtaF [Shouchella shacheensis]|uniref:sporulation membrane protein YtaF n=1 Tax=Shouchella shacheensis TaxID=1649580 RepID=UPI00073FF96A|nr:sporulation membrane protein YtaF [Shouchella shacheensis]